MKRAWLHVDTDGLQAIYEAHGRSFSGPDAFYTSAIRNSLAFFDCHKAKATYFVIARDLADPEKRAGLKDVVAQGHRVASHSFTHPLVYTLDADALRHEVVDSKAEIENVLGVPCEGFRAPGYSISLAALELIAETGYAYDSSIFPNFEFRKRLQMERLFPEPFRLFRDPDLFEIPMPSGLPGLPPFHPCYSFYLGFSYFRRALNAFAERNNNLTFLFHFTDFADPHPGVDSLKLKIFTNNFFSRESKIRFLDRMLDHVTQRYRLLLVEQALANRTMELPEIEPKTVLGISTTHETGACVVRNDQVLSAITEERLTRKKFDTAFPPTNSIREAIRISGVEPQSIDAIVVAGLRWPDLLSQSLASLKADIRQLDTWTDIVPHVFRIPYRLFAFLRASGYGSVRTFLEKEYGISPPLLFVEHHQAHAASAYRTGESTDALVVTADGVGDDVCFTISEPSKGALIRKLEWYYPNSFGQFYTACTQLLGFKAGHHEGKITGLAAFGKNNPEVRNAVLSTLHAGPFKLNKKYYVEGLARGFGKAGLWRGQLDTDKLDHRNYKTALKTLLAPYSREDIARTFQQLLEEKAVEVIVSHAAVKDRPIAVAGGVFANVKLNAAVYADSGARDFWVFPAMGDGGLAVGAALELTAAKPAQLPHVYLGSSYDDTEIDRVLSADGRVTWAKPDDMAQAVAKLLAEGQTIARFWGAMEFGPRALGHRSILYSCANKDVNVWLNKQLKRSEFMPFAPICLYEDAEDYFVLRGGEKRACEFMTIVTPCTERMKNECPAAVHIDGTARPQLVRQDIEPGLHAILRAYKALTGSSCLINTSFNMHEEPIVRTPQEAVQAYLQANLDWLIVGSFLVQRKDGSARTTEAR